MSNSLCGVGKSNNWVHAFVLLGGSSYELREYVTDKQMSLILYDPEEVDTRMDSDWYCHLFNIKSQGQHKYRKLSKLVKAALHCFSGPIVEGMINIMDNILEKDRTRMTQQNFGALLSVKQILKASGGTATTYPISVDMRSMILQAYAMSTKDQTKTLSLRSRKLEAPISD
ncbi:hypothetical protein RRG08_056305 [Elysia crispata]|uniref:Uncharacterized protein n=1 Tax=Elysia crispata TaxID=231223 RepID=A0AAE1AXS0_9GAST|nr:hypothetical protein RRG08_056305 [Elysia crispata]